MTDLTPRQARILAEQAMELRALRDRLSRVERSQDTRLTTLRAGDGRGLQVVDEAGAPVLQIGGDSSGGGDLIQHMGGPVPVQPSAPLLEAGASTITVSVFDTPPADVRLCRVHAGLTADFEVGTASIVGTIPAGSNSVTIGVPAGEWFVRVQWLTLSGKESAPSDVASIEVEPLVDVGDIEATLETARAELDEVRAALEARRGTAPPTEPDTEGRVYYQVDDTGMPVAVWRYTDSQWVPVPLEDAVFARVSTDQLVAGMALIGGALIENGAITAEHITATEALTAKVAKFLKVEAGMIQSNAFEGQTFTGGTFNGALFQTSSTPLRGVKMSGPGLRAWDDTGKLTANIDGKNNLLSGVLRTSPSGEAGLVIDPQDASSRRPVLFFSPDGSTTSDVAAIYTSPDWDLILRGRLADGVRRGVQIDGGLDFLSGGITGDQARILVDQVGANDVHSRLFLSTEGSLSVAGTSQLNGNVNANNNLSVTGNSDTYGRLSARAAFSAWSISAFVGNSSFSAQLFANGEFRNAGHSTTSQAANTYMDSVGRQFRSTSTTDSKADIQPADVADDLLDLPVHTWVDKAAVERAEATAHQMGPLTEADTQGLEADQAMAETRGFGVLAEDVEAIDPRLAQYGAEGLEGVQYDRLGVALIPVVRRLRDRVEQLEDRAAAQDRLIEALTDRLDKAGI